MPRGDLPTWRKRSDRIVVTNENGGAAGPRPVTWSEPDVVDAPLVNDVKRLGVRLSWWGSAKLAVHRARNGGWFSSEGDCGSGSVKNSPVEHHRQPTTIPSPR